MSDIDFINIVLCVCFAVAIMFIWMSFYPENLNFLRNRIITQEEFEKTKVEGNPLFSQFLLPIAQKLIPYTSRSVKPNELERLAEKIKLAGSPYGIKPIELYNMKFAYALLTIMFGFVFCLLLNLPIFVALAFGALGLVMPELGWINPLIKKRGKQADLELPNILDLISVCLASSLTVDRAISTVCAQKEGMLINEFRRVDSDLHRGSTIPEAVLDMTKRVQSKNVMQVYKNISMADRLGTPIADSLKILSDTLRNDTFELVKQRAARAASLVLLPVLFFIFPAVIILIIGPAVPSFLSGS
jgi:tight adherence protein C